MDINTDPSRSRTMNPDMALGSIPGLDVPLAPGGKQATNTSLFLTGSASPVLLLSTAHEPSASLSPLFLYLVFAHHNGTHPPGAKRPGDVFSQPGL